MDREVWHAAVHGVTKNWTQLSDWTELRHSQLLLMLPSLLILQNKKSFPWFILRNTLGLRAIWNIWKQLYYTWKKYERRIPLRSSSYSFLSLFLPPPIYLFSFSLNKQTKNHDSGVKLRSTETLAVKLALCANTGTAINSYVILGKRITGLSFQLFKTEMIIQ